MCSFSKKANDPVVEVANNGARREATPEEVIEIIEEEYTEPGPKSDAESAPREDENLNGKSSYFAN